MSPPSISWMHRSPFIFLYSSRSSPLGAVEQIIPVIFTVRHNIYCVTWILTIIASWAEHVIYFILFWELYVWIDPMWHICWWSLIATHSDTDHAPLPSLFTILAGTDFLKHSFEGKCTNARLPGCCAEVSIVFMLKHFLVWFKSFSFLFFRPFSLRTRLQSSMDKRLTHCGFFCF